MAISPKQRLAHCQPRVSQLLALLAIALLLSGCAKIHSRKQGPAKYQTVAASDRHDTKTAKAKHQRALKFLKADTLDEAERLLNEALMADSTYGPAHNSLGTVYFSQRKLYLAAWEFEYAVKLMPDLAEPYNNLGLVYEQAGKYDDAISYYSMALSHDGNNPELVGNLVRARMLTGDRSQDLREMLSDLALNHQNKRWQLWARDQIELTRFDDSTVCLLDGSIVSEEMIEPYESVMEQLPTPSEVVPQPVIEAPATDRSSRITHSAIEQATESTLPMAEPVLLQPLNFPAAPTLPAESAEASQ